MFPVLTAYLANDFSPFVMAEYVEQVREPLRRGDVGLARQIILTLCRYASVLCTCLLLSLRIESSFFLSVCLRLTLPRHPHPVQR